VRGVIVCGVDGSRVAREALRTAERLAGGLGLAIIAAHVVAPAAVRNTAWTARAEADVDGLAAGEGLLRQACADAGVSDVEQRVLAGRPAERLAELADGQEAELIVVGSRGHRLRQVAFVGGVASELIGLAPCPVLVVPALALDWDAAA
jgi:nucleotide-binding universal stress UspA family protein